MPNNIAWAAGLFEGEGCFCRSTTPSIKIGMNDEDVVRRFVSIVDPGGKVRLATRQRGRSDHYVWQVNGLDNFIRIVNLFWPYLGERRRKKAQEIIDWAKQRPGQGTRAGYGRRKNEIAAIA